MKIKSQYVINIDGRDVILTRDQAVQLHQSLAKELGLDFLTIPTYPAPSWPAHPDTWPVSPDPFLFPPSQGRPIIYCAL